VGGVPGGEEKRDRRRGMGGWNKPPVVKKKTFFLGYQKHKLQRGGKGKKMGRFPGHKGEVGLVFRWKKPRSTPPETARGKKRPQKKSSNHVKAPNHILNEVPPREKN